MADKNEIRAALKRKIDISIRGYVPDQQLNEAADRLIRARKADRKLLLSSSL
jgi:hypothetical protein